MRIAIVCPYSLSRPGGVQGQVLGLARALGAEGHPVLVVAPDDDRPPGWAGGAQPLREAAAADPFSTAGGIGVHARVCLTGATATCLQALKQRTRSSAMALR